MENFSFFDFLKHCTKVIIAMIMTLFVLSLFSFFYYNFGIRKTNPTGSTDYTFENKIWSYGYEGFSFGITDEKGLNNLWKSKKDSIDILLMGSSQMEARNVMQKSSAAYLINKYLSDAGIDIYLYNIAVEGHAFYRSINNLPYALKEYHPTKYVIIEMNGQLIIDQKIAFELLNGTYKRSQAFDAGLIYYLQKIPYLRLLHKQYVAFQDSLNEKKNIKDDYDREEPFDYMDIFFHQIKQETDKFGCKLILFYIPSIKDYDEENIYFNTDLNLLKYIIKCCKDNDIEFIDLSDNFKKLYIYKHRIPYGFINTVPGKGHLNKYGHQVVAETLSEFIISNEIKN